MDDRKLAAIQDYFIAAMGAPDTDMWFAIPGGMIAGKPISAAEYYEILGIPSGIEDTRPDQQTRFFYLKNVSLNLGGQARQNPLAILDGMDVSAWGVLKKNSNNAAPAVQGASQPQET